MTQEEVDEIIHELVSVHGRDPNFPARIIDMARRYVDDPTAREQLYDELKIEAALVKIVCILRSRMMGNAHHTPLQNSPYAEVRAVVSNKDDPSIVRAVFI